MPGRSSIFNAKQNELRNIQEKTTEVSNASAERTRELLSLCHECEDAGVNTLNNLKRQGKQLNRTERGLDATETELDKADIRLGNIERKEKAPWYLLPCALCMTKDPDKHRPKLDPNDVDSVVDYDEKKGEPSVSATTNRSNVVVPIKTGAVAGKPDLNQNSADHEIDRNLGQVSTHLGNLKNVATDMNVEAGKQNKQIGRMNTKAGKTQTKLDKVTNNTVNLLGESGEGSGKKSNSKSIASKARACCCYLC